jgi:DNA polymerase-4
VQPPRRTPELSQETFLGEEENDDRILLAELYRLVEDCGWRLRRTARLACSLSLTVNYADGVAMQRSARLPAPASHDVLLFATAEQLFRQTCTRRVRTKGLKIACTDLVPELRQLELFSDLEGAQPHHAALQSALDCLRARHGMASIRWGRTLY